MANTVRILLVEDSEIVRERIASLLNAQKGLAVVGQAEQLNSATTLTAKLQPDVVFLDIELAGQSGLDYLEWLQGREYPPLVIVLTSFNDPLLRQRCAEMGADFFFHKASEFEKAISVCQEIARRRAGSGPRPGARVLDPAWEESRWAVRVLDAVGCASFV